MKAIGLKDFGMKFGIGPISDEVKLWMSFYGFRQ